MSLPIHRELELTTISTSLFPFLNQLAGAVDSVSQLSRTFFKISMLEASSGPDLGAHNPHPRIKRQPQHRLQGVRKEGQ